MGTKVKWKDRQNSGRSGLGSRKLGSRWQGPFIVNDCRGSVYIIQDGRGSKVVNGTQLRRWHDTPEERPIRNMTSIHTDRPPQPLVDHNRCGRNGCPSNVKRGLQGHAWKAWWHFKCTGLQDDQISRPTNSPAPLVFASCLYVKDAMHTAAKTRVPRNGTHSPVQMPKDHCHCSALIGILDAKLERLSKALEDSGAKNAATWAKVDKEHSSLNQYLLITIRHLFMRILALASILPRAENIKSSATPFFHLCLPGERQPLTYKNKTDPGNLGKSLDPVYQSVNP
ncbi:hypothetical protein T265_04267 [Opisthorchis viverrini]|uniref:Uncharacterized protein n=1 Tax=Opisthorchis viverrini TaxID=6198 RepID=A0A075A081_OPIVI|nr:hypothetical protein T265_04267 [Opisthorchis viverrini]KER28970.1 hypothetical protein T265_04267 [Opisthorchis viverrini]